MSDAAWQQKQDKIRRLLEMQRKFMAYDREHGVAMKDYFAPGADHPLKGFREEYSELAMEVVDDAHASKGSKRD